MQNSIYINFNFKHKLRSLVLSNVLEISFFLSVFQAGHTIHVAGVMRLDVEETFVDSIYVTVWALLIYYYTWGKQKMQARYKRMILAISYSIIFTITICIMLLKFECCPRIGLYKRLPSFIVNGFLNDIVLRMCIWLLLFISYRYCLILMILFFIIRYL